ncbi:hypothetical protein OIU74_020074 [Salix koriyanagi]|uniref:Uncharacterized protein n=1 Tax=Salix koriyanagi TaxID=2511006 RepID=A0A9Q0P538_9ROSI|nr:hypothetical protein OIU74_020074 [Salix koriyanagi]
MAKSPLQTQLKIIEKPRSPSILFSAAPEKTKPAFPPLPLAARTGSTALVEYKGPVLKEEEEDLEVKLRRILENVPVRVSNTSGSSAGSGSVIFTDIGKSV